MLMKPPRVGPRVRCADGGKEIDSANRGVALAHQSSEADAAMHQQLLIRLELVGGRWLSCRQKPTSVTSLDRLAGDDSYYRRLLVRTFSGLTLGCSMQPSQIPRSTCNPSQVLGAR